MQKRDVTIGLLWHSMNSDNLGVGALSVAHIALLRKATWALNVRPRFLVLCWSDPKPAYSVSDDVEIIPLRLRDFLNPFGLWAQIRRCNIVFDIGAGDSFADIYGAARISKMLWAQNIVLITGRKLILGPQTIGPFQRPWIRRLAVNLLRRASMVTVRDAQSAACAREIGFRGDLTQATDVALDLPYSADEAERDHRGTVKVGINVSGLLFHGGYTRKNMFGLKADYARAMHRIIDAFHQRTDCEVHLISHVQSDTLPVEDDRRAALALGSKFPNCVIAPGFANPSEAKSYIAGMDFFTGARMHACIAAFSSGVPVIPMAYSRKFAGLFGSLGYPHWVDCTTDSEDEIVARIVRGFEGRTELARDLIAARAEGSRRLDAYSAKARACLADTLEQMA